MEHADTRTLGRSSDRSTPRPTRAITLTGRHFRLVRRTHHVAANGVIPVCSALPGRSLPWSTCLPDA
jgi:hypothetical protein